ncbi:MAG: hypothetical protein KAH86_02060, partial [Methanosarcinales archaeon]|nr:hypothetical protein [Methanosarcinales archaeon]
MKEASESQDQIIQGYQSLSHLIISSIAPYHVYLVLILILSLMLQYQKLGWGLVTDSADFFGLSAFHIAESTLVKIPVTILENNDWNPHFFDEPSLFYNTMAVTFFSIKSLFGSLSLVQYVKVARILTILFTLITIAGTFFIAKEIWDTETGLF